MNVLEVRELRKTYPAFTLKGVSLDVPQGAIVGFIGRNGAGKSTTLKSVLGLVHPDGGTVRAFGLDYAANEAAIRRRIGVVLGGIDFYPKKRVGVITDVTRPVLQQLGREEVPPLSGAVRHRREQAGGSAVQRHEGEVHDRAGAEPRRRAAASG